MASTDFEVVIIGAGVVGLAIAAHLSVKHARIAVLEKNAMYGMETSSRNSEVIHAGIYYQPGSLKASLCVEGREELYALCKKHNIPFSPITKIISARTPDELPILQNILENGTANGVDLKILDAKETQRLEPNITTCGSIFSPRTGIISAHALMDYYFHTSKNQGATIQCQCEVVGIEKTSGGYSVTINDSGSMVSFTTEKVINAAGLYSDRIASLAGINIDDAGYRLHFCKGSYFSISSSKSKLISRLVYPVPTKDSLGVHALLDLGGRLKFGPDVEYLTKNEQDYTVSDAKRMQFLESIQKILPSVAESDIAPDMCGIRPKLKGEGMPRDFVMVHEKERGLTGLVNLIGIESPGLTASPAIARYVEKLLA
jgi:L-2-hydroxyglutarate oxidase LhgO